ncbi:MULTISPECIES: hypothetical protein [Odoribacteraceae]|uniref:hypothetical protein n=1 Tax=Odoribacteraceae TaxID=1853231 RepID=UPI000E540261|nr:MULTISPECIES: hypothetical protein [Odoribacteraceae]MCQ4872175.1 hypothetical protein [Butyricimonas paravirosa]RHR80727.1 hypothetical protein DWW52_06955 [Odoribacter sp. AF15-53]
MNIEKLHGTDPRLYELVAPLVMSIPVLRQNNNYPFKTSANHKWLVATEGDEVKGFMPVEIKKAGACIDNYHVPGDNSTLLAALIDFAKKEFTENQPLFVVSHARDAEVFRTNGFTVFKEWKLYVKMVYSPAYENQKECV